MMIFDRDKQFENKQLKSLPFIFQKPQQYHNQSNKSLYKNDSQSSHLTITPQNYQLHYDKSIKYTLNAKNSFVANDIQNSSAIKKYLKKGQQFNKFNAKKIFKLDNLPNENSLSYKFSKDFSINRFQNQQEIQGKSLEKNLKKTYLSQKKQRKSNNTRLSNLKHPNNKRVSALSKFSQPKQIKRLVNQQVQTQKIKSQKVPFRNKKIKQTNHLQKSHSPKINTFEEHQQLNQVKINKQFNSNKGKFINLSSILQKDQEQPQPPKKFYSIRNNNLQTKNIINQSFTGQQSTAPSLYANSYLDSMSKLSYNFTNDIEKIKKNRYEPSSLLQRYSKTIEVIPNKQAKQIKEKTSVHEKNEKTSSKQQMEKEENIEMISKLGNHKKSRAIIKNQTISLNSQSKRSISKNLNNLNPQQSSMNKNQNTFQNKQKSVSLSIVPEQTENAKSVSQNDFQGKFSVLQVVNEEKHQFNLQQFDSQKLKQNKYRRQISPIHFNHNPDQVKKVDEMMQFPQISELKISSTLNENQMKKIKQIHPIRNNFNEKGVNWILDTYNPKSKILQSINLQTFQIKKYRNGVYFGQLNEQSKKNGNGIIFYYNGKLYEGQFANDLKDGNGYEQFPDGSKYQGQFRQGTKNGKGIFDWSNGEVYEGQWKNGKKHGSGIWKSSQGQSYIGEWINGQVEGFGVYISKFGDRYQGEFKNSKKQGFGTQRYSNGQTYVGQYRKNRPNGQGEYFWANGNYYKGQFVNHLRHGEGYFKEANNNQTYQGQYRNDKKCGYGQLKIGQTTYVGNFQNDYKHGYGQFFQNQQCKYTGYWINGKLLEQQENQRQQVQIGSTIKSTRIQTISQRPELTNINTNSNARVNRLARIYESKNQHKNQIARPNLSKSKSPQNKSIQSLQNSLDKSNYKRSCGCAKRH